MTAPLLDTNILVYAFTDDLRSATAQTLLSEPFILSVQALNEFANVAWRKLGMNWAEIRLAIGDLGTLATAIVPVDKECNSLALDLAARYNFSVFDALMIATALQAGSERCFSEDMQHGLVVDGRLTILNPFLNLPA
ncbi:PIN domain-containing protein [Pararhizobium sp. YC-54]|uniref:PIN domain-containing protein n=1 Tax=Pararhizobium sp. YC-54 TaxID=2986920 RepID=UPI0021F759B2|nr:PIN domain-containing protein [Pararhizobium sp. YC-54]MCW0000468.1 PIN domain-containing protein [Pararhizobium sp. YC-54]